MTTESLIEMLEAIKPKSYPNGRINIIDECITIVKAHMGDASTRKDEDVIGDGRSLGQIFHNVQEVKRCEISYIDEMLEKHADRADMFQPETQVIETRWVRLMRSPEPVSIGLARRTIELSDKNYPGDYDKMATSLLHTLEIPHVD